MMPILKLVVNCIWLKLFPGVKLNYPYSDCLMGIKHYRSFSDRKNYLNMTCQ